MFRAIVKRLPGGSLGMEDEAAARLKACVQSAAGIRCP